MQVSGAEKNIVGNFCVSFKIYFCVSESYT